MNSNTPENPTGPGEIPGGSIERGRQPTVDEMVEARIEPLRAQVGALTDKVVTLVAENELLRRDNQELIAGNESLKRAMHQIQRRAGRPRMIGGIEFKGETPEERDSARVDWVRERLEVTERKGRSLPYMQQRRFLYVIESVEDPDLKEAIYSEFALRQEWQFLFLQWENVCGDADEITSLVGKKRAVMKLEQLKEMSGLAEANDGEGRERVSLSVQVSRAMNLYFNFLGAWAEAFSDDEAKKRFMETFRRVDGDRAKSEDEKEREVRREVERYAGTKAGEAQERLAHLSADHEARIYFIEERGVKAFHLKKILQNFPKELSNYRADFQDEVKGASDDKYFDLSDIFGKCMFTQGVSAEDILWSRSWVAALSGSISAETMALWMLDFTGETDVLNGCWKRYMRDNRTMEYYHGWQGDAYRPSDYQKLIRMEARRRDEAKKLYPHGYDANLGKLPEESGRGWFENAKIETVGENRAEGEERRQTVKDMLRGLRRDKMGRVVRVCEPRPFHQIDWDQLPRDTYTLDFLIPNLRYGQVFRNFMKELEFPKDFTFDSLRATNKALELSFGKKDDFVERVGEIYPEDKWVRKSPWVWYVIGAISLHNPWGQKLLEGMRTPPTLVELWLRNVSSTQKTEGRYVPTYEELVRGKVIASGFLREEELKFVEEYCQGKIR